MYQVFHHPSTQSIISGILTGQMVKEFIGSKQKGLIA